MDLLRAVAPEALRLLAQLRAAHDRVVAENKPLVLDEAGDRDELHVRDEVALALVGRHEGARPRGRVLHERARVARAAFLGIAEGVRDARVGHAAHAVRLHGIAPREVAAAAVARHLHVASFVCRGGIAVVDPEEGGVRHSVLSPLHQLIYGLSYSYNSLKASKSIFIPSEAVVLK